MKILLIVTFLLFLHLYETQNIQFTQQHFLPIENVILALAPIDDYNIVSSILYPPVFNQKKYQPDYFVNLQNKIHEQTLSNQMTKVIIPTNDTLITKLSFQREEEKKETASQSLTTAKRAVSPVKDQQLVKLLIQDYRKQQHEKQQIEKSNQKLKIESQPRNQEPNNIAIQIQTSHFLNQTNINNTKAQNKQINNLASQSQFKFSSTQPQKKPLSQQKLIIILISKINLLTFSFILILFGVLYILWRLREIKRKTKTFQGLSMLPQDDID